jgi:fructose 1,6-bisphosphatase
MKITVSVIKADIESVGGHMAPSSKLFETVKKHVREKGKGFLIDSYVSFTGDDVAILMTHAKGVGNEQVHKLAWDAFVGGYCSDEIAGSLRRRPGSSEGRLLGQRPWHGAGGHRNGIRRTAG